MAMSYKQSIAIAVDSGFWENVVTFAILRTAVAVFSENPATVGHIARAALATAVANNPSGYVARFAYLICCDDAFIALTVPQGNALSPAAAETRVSAVWNLLAGA